MKHIHKHHITPQKFKLNFIRILNDNLKHLKPEAPQKQTYTLVECRFISNSIDRHFSNKDSFGLSAMLYDTERQIHNAFRRPVLMMS